MGNVVWGLKWGLKMAAGFSLIAIVVLATTELLPGPPAELPVPALHFFALYVACGVISGSFVGAFRPQLANRWGATVIGILAAVPWYFGIRVLAFGWENWSAFDIVFLVIAPIVVGGPVSQLIWAREHSSRR